MNSVRSTAILFVLGLLPLACGDSTSPKVDAAPTASDAGGASGAARDATPSSATDARPDAAALVTSDAAASMDSGSADTNRADVAAAQPDTARADGAADAAAADRASDTSVAPGDGASADVNVPPGATLVGPAGATLQVVNGGELIIPAGALAQATAITFKSLNTDFPAVPGSVGPLSFVLSLEPHGQTFLLPVTLKVTHRAGQTRAGLFTAQPRGTFELVPTAVFTATTATALLDHFSYFVVAEAPGPSDAGAADTGVDAATPATDASSATDAAGATVVARGEALSFDPEQLTVKVGSTVTWSFPGSGHSVVSGGIGGTAAGDCAVDGKFASGVKNTGETFSFTFTQPGTYGYHCAAHCAQFEGGTVVVQP